LAEVKIKQFMLDRKLTSSSFASLDEPIASGTSVTLDLLRIGSALVVFLCHCIQFLMPAMLPKVQPLAHHAVLIFFVLSGYVIAFSVSRQEQLGLRSYVVSRLSRLYSVVIPALLLTALLFFAGTLLFPAFYAEMSRGSDYLRILCSAAFLQSIWFLSAAPPTNAPLWSLSYEAWYYLIFGCAVLIRSKHWKILFTGIAAFMAGPNILLLLPVWLIGVAAFLLRKIRATNSGSPVLAGTLLCAASAGISACANSLPNLPREVGLSPLYYSSAFISDWLFGICIGIFIVAIDLFNLAVSPVLCSRIRAASEYTFPIYLYHYPVIVFIAAAISSTSINGISVALTSLLAFVLVMILSLTTERYRPLWLKSTHSLAAHLPRIILRHKR